MIAILDSFTLPQALSEGYLHHICLTEQDSGNFVYDDFGLLFIELLKFDKQEQELETELDKWLYVLKHISRMKKLPLVLRKPVFEKLFDIAAYVNLSEKEKMMYDISLKRKWDKHGAMLALLKDVQEQVAEEMSVAIAAGRAEGIEQGILTNALTIGKSLKEMGLDVAVISKATGLSQADVQSL